MPATSAHQPETRELPLWVYLVLKALILALAAAIVVVPEIPAANLAATDPLKGGDFIIRIGGQHDVPFNLAWAFEGLRGIPLAARIVFFAVVAGLCAIPPRWKGLGPRTTQPLRPLHALLIAVAAGALAALLLYLFRVPYERAKGFGDGRALPQWVETNFSSATEPVTLHLYSFARFLLLKCFHEGRALAAIVMVVCLSGGLFVGSMALLALTVGRSHWERATLFAGATLCGYLSMFFGYPETTPVALAAAGAYLACGALVLTSESPMALTPAKIWAFAMCALAITSHGAAILLVPSLLFLVADVLGDSAGPWRGRWKTAVSAQSLTLFAVLIAAPIVLISIAPFFPAGKLGNMTGGGDRVQLVPWTINYAHREGGYYPMVSLWHLLDLGNSLWIAAPLAPLFIILAAAFKRRYRLRWTDPEANLLGLVGVAAALCLVIPVAWNHDFGMWGDWNIAACYLFPLNLLGWLLVVVVLRRLRPSVGHYAGIVAPLVLIQVACAVGLLGQLY